MRALAFHADVLPRLRGSCGNIMSESVSVYSEERHDGHVHSVYKRFSEFFSML